MTEDGIILTHILKCQPLDLALNRPALTNSQQKLFEDYKRRREAGEPLQYILGTCNFMGLELTVNPSVLVPRPETEQLVDLAVNHLADAGNLRILDLGTGCGNIAVALAKFVPQSQIITVDISTQALAVARANARRHGVKDKIKFICADMFVILSPSTSLRAGSAKDLKAPLDSSLRCFLAKARIGAQNDNDLFDLIISNPPYVPTGQLKTLPQDVQKEPAMALDGGEDGLNFYRIVIEYTPYLLREGAGLMMEFGDGQARSVKKLMEAQKAFSSVEIIQDLAGRDRIIYGKVCH